MKNNSLKTTLISIGVPTLYALLLRFSFGIDTWSEILSVMSLTFLVLLPTIIGALTVYLSSPEKVSKVRYRIFAPWIPVLLFLAITLLFAIEGWACWVMVLPLFFVAASIGGLIGGYLKNKKSRAKLQLSLLVLLPFVIAPLESLIETIPGTYKAYTYIDIDAPADFIWNHVTRVSEISDEEDSGLLGNFLGFPRPIKAELNYNGVGAHREAIFSGGLIFNETVTEYTHHKKMAFTIKANTFDIPSTTLDEHILIGGSFFDVLNGTYELEKLGPTTYRLHLYSHFKMNTTFNFYAGWWGKWIMKDIQNNILKIEKARSELDYKNSL